MRAVKEMKNTRSWLENINLKRTISDEMYVKGGQSIHKSTLIGTSEADIPDMTNVIYVGGGQHIHKEVYIHE